MKRHNVNKANVIRAVMSLTMASTIFISSNFGASVAHAEPKEIGYKYKRDTAKMSDFTQMVDEGQNLSGKTVIISTNDVHGGLHRYPYVASLKNFFQNDLKAEVILVDSGDFSQDKKPDGNEGAESTFCMEPSHGYAGIEAMNAVGYNLATLGNHEFEDFVDLENNIKKANFKVINSNLVKPAVSKKLEEITSSNPIEENKKNEALMNAFNSLTYKDYFLKDQNYIYTSESGIKIGFFGLLTREAPLKKYRDKYKKLKDDLAVACAKYQIQSLKKDGADIVVCLSHLGLEDSVKGNRSIDLYNGVTAEKDSNDKPLYPLDLVLDGHSHNEMSAGENDEPLLAGGLTLSHIGITIIGKNDKNEAQIEKSVIVTLDDVKETIGYDEENAKTIIGIIEKYNKSFLNETKEPAITETLEKLAEQEKTAKKSDSKRRKIA